MQTVERGPHTVYSKAAINIPNIQGHEVLQNQNYRRYDFTNPGYDRIRGAREGRLNSKLPVHVLSSTKVRPDIQAYIQPKATKSFCKSQTLPTIQSLQSSKFFTTRGLDDKTGLKSSLFSRSYCSAPSQISQTELPSESLSASTVANDLFTVRPVFSAQNFCLNNQLGCGVFEASQYQMCGIFRRFLACEPLQISARRRRGICDKDTAATRMDNKLREVCTSSDTMPRIPGHNMGHKTQRNVLVGAEVLNATQSTSPTAPERQMVPQTVPNTTGETQFRDLCYAERSASLSHTAILQSTAVEAAPVPSDLHATTCSLRDGMVVSIYRQVDAHTPKHGNASVNDRCIGHRVGSPTQRFGHCGFLDRTAEVLACQSKRDVCCLRGYTPEPISTSERACAFANRQSDSSLIYKQGGRNKIEKAASSNSPTPYNLGRPKHSLDGALFSGPVQCRSGRSFSKTRVSGMASEGDGNIKNISNVGHSGDRLVCLKDSSRCANICVIRQERSRSDTPQLLLSSVALQPSVVVSSPKSNSPCSETSESSQRVLHTNCSKLEQGVLAGRRTTASETASLSDPGPSPLSNRHENRNASTTSTRPEPGGLADFGWQDILTEWTDQEQKLLMSSWRGSTINTYKPAWRRWKQWCESHSVSHLKPNADQVARYLAHLHCDIGLAYRTILVHKSVISSFTHLTSNINLSSNFFIKHILRAISLAKEMPAKPPIWNPKAILQFMSTYRFDENNIHQVSRHVATLLLLASGRRVHDLTLLRIDGNNLIDNDSSIVLWPAFGSKTDSVRHRQSGWRLKVHPDKNLDAVFWLRQLLKISANRRNTVKSLFITAIGDVKPASRTVIGGWVKSLLRMAGINATPGSVRSAVASLNFVENFPIDQILSTGNWKMIHTFQKYYQRELINHESNASISLSNYFDPVN